MNQISQNCSFWVSEPQRSVSNLYILRLRELHIPLFKCFFLQWRERLENFFFIFLPPPRRNSGYGLAFKYKDLLSSRNIYFQVQRSTFKYKDLQSFVTKSSMQLALWHKTINQPIGYLGWVTRNTVHCTLIFKKLPKIIIIGFRNVTPIKKC